MRVLVATLTAMFAGSVGFLDPRKTHGSHEALAVATPAIVIRGGEPEMVMDPRHSARDLRPIRGLIVLAIKPRYLRIAHWYASV